VTFNTTTAILDGLTTAVFVIDGNRRILLANTAAADLFGVGLVDQDFVQAVRHPDCLQSVEDVLGGRDSSAAVISLPLPVPSIYRVSVVGLNPDDETGARAVISFDDISHVLEAEHMRSDFVANVSHELRSPLTALSGFIETLKSAAKDDPAARERFLDIMERESLRMNRLIDDLLSLSKIEINERVRPAGLVNITTIIENVITTLCAQTTEERCAIRLEKPAGIDLIPGDEDELTEVFQNLIDNAIKYGEPGSEVVVSVREVGRTFGIQGPALAIDVQDQGPGIAAEHIPRLTERFYRVDDSRSRDKGGTGLGLAIVKHILNRHLGRLQIRSEPGNGSTFTALLPMKL